MIRLEGLSCRPPGYEVPALREISIHIPEKRLVCLLGGNGSGKSTLLQILAGLLRPEGRARVLGHELPDEADKLRGEVAYLPQEPDVYILGSTVQEDLFLSAAAAAAEEEARRLADAFGLSGLFPRPVHQLSHGEKRKLCLASALAVAPRLLLLDEPESGLDFSGRLELRRIIQANRAQGMSQVVALHDLELFGDLPDLFLVLERGRLGLAGGRGEVFPALRELGLRAPGWWQCGRESPPGLE